MIGCYAKYLILFVCIVFLLAHTRTQAQATVNVKKLEESEIITEEWSDALTQPDYWYAYGFAAIYVPHKGAIFRDWRLALAPPKGDSMEPDTGIREKALKNMKEAFGETVEWDAVLKLADFYEDFIPTSDRNELIHKEGQFFQDVPESIYFAAVKYENYNMQLLGEVGEFVSIFVKLPSLDIADTVLEKFFPKIDQSELQDASDRYSPGVVKICRSDGIVTVRTGERFFSITDKRKFYGLRIDVNLNDAGDERDIWSRKRKVAGNETPSSEESIQENKSKQPEEDEEKVTPKSQVSTNDKLTASGKAPQERESRRMKIISRKKEDRVQPESKKRLEKVEPLPEPEEAGPNTDTNWLMIVACAVGIGLVIYLLIRRRK